MYIQRTVALALNSVQLLVVGSWWFPRLKSAEAAQICLANEKHSLGYGFNAPISRGPYTCSTTTALIEYSSEKILAG